MGQPDQIGPRTCPVCGGEYGEHSGSCSQAKPVTSLRGRPRLTDTPDLPMPPEEGYPKVITQAESVVRAWAFTLKLKMQAVLFLALRGCDTEVKDGPTKHLVRALRFVVLRPADENPGSFMWIEGPPAKFPNIDPYPVHWAMHLLHAIEIVGYEHPNEAIRWKWRDLYVEGCNNLHLAIEPRHEMYKRLKGDNDAR